MAAVVPVPQPGNDPVNAQRQGLQLQNFNHFNALYKRPRLPVLPALPANYRTQPYPNPGPPVHKRIPRRHHSQRRPPPKDEPATKTAPQRRFLREVISELRAGTKDPNSYGRWRGVKILGQGGYGVVGLWVYNGEAAELRNLPLKLVVKQVVRKSQALADDLRREGQLHERLTELNSDHIAGLLIKGHEIQPGELTADPVARWADSAQIWVKRVRRLIMEYYPLGSLTSLLDRRDYMEQPFSELTLWEFFDCMVDGIAAMSESSEYVYDEAQDTAALATPPVPGWRPIVHFDIKPQNILLSDRDANHTAAPGLKFTDFGGAKAINPRILNNHEDFWILREEARASGTYGFLAPEQFSERWNYSDWNTSNPRVAGVYGPATNVWGIGVTMYVLIYLTHKANSDFAPPKPCLPDNLHGEPPLGLTYGEGLIRLRKYSETLRHLVLKCLYEVPAHRPTIQQLKEEIARGKRYATRPYRGGKTKAEPWKDFLFADPDDVLSESDDSEPDEPSSYAHHDKGAKAFRGGGRFD